MQKNTSDMLCIRKTSAQPVSEFLCWCGSRLGGVLRSCARERLWATSAYVRHVNSQFFRRDEDGGWNSLPQPPGPPLHAPAPVSWGVSSGQNRKRAKCASHPYGIIPAIHSTPNVIKTPGILEGFPLPAMHFAQVSHSDQLNHHKQQKQS